MRFRENNDIMLHDINSDVIQMYEAYLHSCGITKNTCSFYMRILRAVYNRAVDQGLIQQLKPFRNVYTGVDKTVKRALSFDEIKEIKNLDLPHNSNLDFARDMFLFSFYTRGMSFIDMAYLKKKNLVNGMLKYYRHKTGQLLCIRWEECMQKIIDKYRIAETPYLLPIITKSNTNPRLQYLNTMRLINNHLKRLAKLLNLRIPLSMYVARHSWANIAHCKNIPIKCCKSLTYTHTLETIKDIANNNKYCAINISGYNRIYFVIPIPLKITNANIITVEIKKFTASLVTTEIGNISLGKYTFFNMFPFSIIVNADLEIAVEKNVHGINPQHKKTT